MDVKTNLWPEWLSILFSLSAEFYVDYPSKSDEKLSILFSLRVKHVKWSERSIIRLSILFSLRDSSRCIVSSSERNLSILFSLRLTNVVGDNFVILQLNFQSSFHWVLKVLGNTKKARDALSFQSSFHWVHEKIERERRKAIRELSILFSLRRIWSSTRRMWTRSFQSSFHWVSRYIRFWRNIRSRDLSILFSLSSTFRPRS